MMRIGSLVCAVCVLATAAPAGELVVSLDPGPGGPAEDFQPATLTIHNLADTTIRSLSIQWQLGGPTMAHTVAIPPDGTHGLTVRLPAMTRYQRFDIEASTEADGLLAAEAEIAWPVDWVDPAVWINSRAYEPYQDRPAGWSGSMRRAVWWSGLLGCVLLVAAAVMPWRQWRLALAAAVIVMALAVVCWIAADTDVVTESVDPDGDELLLLSRRRAGWTSPRTDLVPIYATRSQMMEDDLRYGDDGVSMTLQPGRARLFRLPEAPDP